MQSNGRIGTAGVPLDLEIEQLSRAILERQIRGESAADAVYELQALCRARREESAVAAPLRKVG